MDRQNLIIADCEEEEVIELAKGLEHITKHKFSIKSKICNGTHTKLNNIKRYIIYMVYPLKILFKRKEYKYVIGWQQFFALFFAFYSRLFKVKKNNIVVACNFTYKDKRGFLGKIYKKFMKYCVTSDYLDYIHVPSHEYAKKSSEEFNIPIDKFIITTFGILDTYNKWKDTKVEFDEFVFSIGRSNRDYDFLIDVWKHMPKEYKLVIACDQYKTNIKLPENIIIRGDIIGDKQFPYIANCKMMIIPIKDGSICSGDTVLLKAMSYEKTVVVTSPSTLAEMYIGNEKDGIALKKDVKEFGEYIKELLKNEEKIKEIGKKARQSFLDKFSRYNMGIKIGEILNTD